MLRMELKSVCEKDIGCPTRVESTTWMIPDAKMTV